MARPSRPKDKSSGASPRRRARVEELEPRVLLSADSPFSALESVLTDAVHGTLESADPSFANSEALTGAAEHASSYELVFIDAGVEDRESLIEDLLERRADDSVRIEVVVLDSDRDGVDQISEALASRSNIDAVHVVSHGTDEGIQLGSSWLSGESLDSYEESVASWRSVLSEDADLLLYGCNLAGSADGKALIEQLAILTGADVAASVDATGAALFGGDWDLEHTTGSVEADIAFSAGARAAYGGVLDGTAIWTDNASSTPGTSEFDGANFSGPAPTADVSGEWQVMAGAEAPTRDEKIVVGVDDTGKLQVLVWNGASWTTNAPAGIGTGTVSDFRKWGFDVAYESQSGDALLTYNDGAGGIGYSVWNGTSWSAPQTLTPPIAGEAEQMKLAADPTSDEMVLVMSNANNRVFAFVWDGDAWNGGDHFPMGDGSVDSTDISVAYEQLSGTPMVVFGGSNEDLHYRQWNGSTWSGGGISDPAGGPSDRAQWTAIAADPNSDRIALAVATEFNTAWLTVWDGSSWDTAVLASNNTLHTDRQNVAVTFEASSGEAIAAYTRFSDRAILYQTWAPGAGWSGELRGPTFTTHPDSITLDSDPNSDAVMLSVLEQNRQVGFSLWDGSTFGAIQSLGANAGTNFAQPYLFLWEQGPIQTPVSFSSLWVSTADPFPGGPGPWSAGDIASFGDPGLLLEPAGTAGTFSLAFDVDRFSAGTDIDAIHYVGNDIQIGASSFQLRAGDLLLSVSDNSARFQSGSPVLDVGFSNDLTVAKEDVFVFRPDVAGDYSSGTFAELLVNPNGDHLSGITLIERNVRVGDVDLQAGDFLFSRENGGNQNSVFLFETTDVGALTAGTTRLLLNGSDPGVGISERIYGIDLIEERSSIGGRVLQAGTLVLTFEGAGTAGGLGVGEYDVIALNVSQTTWIAGSNNGVATASLLASPATGGWPGGGSLDGLSLGQPASVIANAAPVLTPSAPSLTTITEDESDPTGDLVSAILGSSVTDADGVGQPGIAITGLTSSNGTWQYDTGSGWTDVGAVSNTSALLLRGTDRVRFVPDWRNADSASFDFRAWDLTTGTAGALADTSSPGGSSAFSVATDTASITVTGVNDAPFLIALATPVLDDVDENAGPPAGAVGTLISDLVALFGTGGIDNVLDVDTGAVAGLAIVDADASNGTWHYSTDGGVSWQLLGSPSDASSRLLAADADTRLYFQANAGFDGTITDAITFRAWDQSSGVNGGTADTSTLDATSAFSGLTDTADITVIDVNVAPSGTDRTVVTDEDVPYAFTTADFGFSDVDGDLLQGVVITTLPGAGTLRNGGSVLIGGETISEADITGGNLTFTPGPQANGAGYASFTFQVQDDGGAPGVDTDPTPNTITIDVTPLNDAPTLTPSTPTLTTISEDALASPGDLVSDLLGTSVSDVDGGAIEGLAVTGLSSGNGTWQFSTDGGSSWSDVPPALSNANALLLRATDRVRFVPDGRNADTASFDFRAWDQTTGVVGTQVDTSINGGTTAYSAAADTASITVTAVNDAPVLALSSPTLPTIGENDLNNAGELVANLLGASVTDVDTGAIEGIAITSLTSGNGTWQYSLDGGSSWSAIPLTVSNANALLLRASDHVRFVPDGQNADTASFDFRAWDQTTGAVGSQVDTSSNGGTTAYSAATDTASITVTGINDAPVLDASGNMTLVDVAESNPSPVGDSVGAIIASAGGDRITDIDVGAVEGIAVIGVDDSNGSWQYSTDGGTIWTDFGAVSNNGAVLLDTADLVRFVPNVGYIGSAGTLDFRAWDQTTGANGQTGVDVSTNGGSTAYSVATETASLNVTFQNAAPVLTPAGPSLPTLTEDDVTNSGALVSTIVGGSISDGNVGSLEGIAINAINGSNGRWQYSTNGGASWSAMPATLSDGSALLLRAVDRVRFVPDAMNAGSGSFDFRAWDQTNGATGMRVDASTNGGQSAFSTAVDTASVTATAVNDAPRIGSATLGPVAADETDPPGAAVASLFGGTISDVDSGSGFAGIAIVGNGANALLQGEWQYRSSSGATWFAVGSVANNPSALVLASGAHVRFVPVATFTGSPPSLVVRGLDDSYGGAFSSTAAGVEVRANVDASVNGGTTEISGATAALRTSVTALDLEPGDLSGIDPPTEEPPTEPPPEEPPEEPPTEEPPTAADAPSLVDVPGPTTSPPRGGSTVTPPSDLDGLRPLAAPDVLDTSSLVTTRIDDDRSEQSIQRTALDTLKQIYLGSSSYDGADLASLIFQGQRDAFLHELDVLQDEIELFSGLETRMVSSTIAVSSGLSVGYVLWLTRGGLLVASLLSSLPAWRLIDPIPILAFLNREEDDEDHDDESLDSLVRGGADKSEGRVDDEDETDATGGAA